MSDLLKRQFDAVAQNYDLQRRQLIPCFDDFYSMAVSVVNTEQQAPRILDLGAGTGLFSSYVRQKYPEASLTLIDLSEEMLKGARHRFRDDSHVQYITADFATYNFEGQKYDVVISSLAIHHLSHQDKRTLFLNVSNLLTEGGIFVNADQASGSSPYFDLYYKEQWEDTIRRNGLTTEVLESAIERRKLDRNASVNDQLQWLLEAGFTESDCIYKYHEFALFYARK
ncbi:class I SAM-dependent methyltransferase [Paenibacillus anaericanus]|uniref:Class I SAM-dependent methyltransferase n=1 Tax=Paenibacillus anaericanus TaxID=170367 RepID=A0A3S1BHX6_9BACL|nr:class I SAM-dependent methyltransferase [Paenibacillus anaericanus]RUT41993.1 class I SAM-dependent methyltransferase [Paenibacillus anaericanus]